MIRCFQILRAWWGGALLFVAAMLLPLTASAGHLFTQAGSNTPVALNSGQCIQITQLTYESNCGGSCNGDVSVNFSGGATATAWSAGDAIQLTIGSWTQTFTYDGMVAAGGAQDGTYFNINSTSLAAAGISPTGQATWTVIATAGQFTFEGYRIYTVGGTAGDTYNGTGAGPINQTQVVSASQLGGSGGFVPVAEQGEKDVARVLDALNGTSTGQMGAVIAAISSMTPDSQRLAMKLISPESSVVLGGAALSTSSSALDTVQVRLDALRTGVGVQSGFRTAHNAHAGDHQEGMSSGDEALNRSFWLKAFGSKSKVGAKSGFAGSESDVYGMMAGFDTQMSNGWLLGGAFSYAKTDVDMNDFRSGDAADISSYQLTGYFGRSFERWYIDGMVAYAYQDYSTKRNTHLTGVAKGDFDGQLYGMRVIAGMPFALSDKLRLTPLLGFETFRVEQGGYTESGAGVLSLAVKSDDVSRLRSLLGVELSSSMKLADSSVLSPAVKLLWRHEFENDGATANSAFVGGGGQFETTGQKAIRDVYALSGRLNWEMSDRFELALELGAEAGEKYQSLNGQVFGRWRF